MGFSPSQQGVYRPLVKKAWQIHAGRNGLNSKDKVAYEIWYREELMKAIGMDSTRDANKGRDFDTCRDHFSAICGDSINEAIELTKQDAKRIIYLIGQICKEHTISDAYVIGTARNITGFRGLINLHQIEDEKQLHKIRQALLMHARRLKRKADGLPPRPRRKKVQKSPKVDPDNCPF